LGFNVSGLIPVDASGANCKAAPTTCVSVKGGTLNSSGFGRPPLPNLIGNREIQYALKFIF